MYNNDFDSLLNTGDEERDLKKLYSVMSSGNDDENSEFIQIGKTQYYKVRKGPHHYRIVSGKKMTDAEFCWKVESHPSSKKQWFVNGLGTKKWHLPDIYQTDAEREKENQMLREKKKREEQEAADRRKAMKRGTEKFELSGPGGGDGGEEEEKEKDAPFRLLKDQSEDLQKQKKKGCCGCCRCVVQ